MLDTIAKGFKTAKQRLQGKAELNEENINEAIKAIRLSLLEADVEYNVVKNFITKVKDKALGEIVQLKVTHADKKMKVSPGDHFIKICQDELENLMGPVDTSIATNKSRASVIMMIGLQGSGKTTTAGKLANYLIKKGKKPLLVAADIYRPAAVEQLKVLGQKLNVPVYSELNGEPPKICLNSLKFADENKRDFVIFDTAGRLAIDEQLMEELEKIKSFTTPDNVFLVCDSMIGQDAVKTAKEFDRRLNLDGFIMTKLDGDTRGGAAISIKEVTGKPIKFLGMGETLENLEEFRPDGLASRILGFGDIVGLVKDLESVVDEKQAEEDAKRIMMGKFTLDDFLTQIKTIKKMGSLKDIFDKMPFFGGELPEGANLDDYELVKVEAMINSMTKEERKKPDIINESQSRINRISAGSGRKAHELRELLMKFFKMRKLMSNLGGGMGMLSKIPGLGQLGKLKKMAGMNMGDLFGGEEDFAQEKKEPKKILSQDEKNRMRNKKKAQKQAKKKNRR